jgi:hypothetical protein
MTGYLSKSDFQVASACPTKLYYRKQGYPGANGQNDYLEFLADGGYMVEAIARLLYAGGVEVGSKDLLQGFATTLQLLNSRQEVTLFDATVLHENMCARIDILRKQGSKLQLIEVKAKSIDGGSDHQPFRNKDGTISSAWESYLADVAYQTWLLQANFPEAAVTPFLCLVDKAASVDVDAIFTQFQLEPADKGSGYRCPKVCFLGDLDRLRANHILKCIDVADEVTEFMPGVQETATLLAGSLRLLTKLPADIGVQCRDCEYRNAATPEDPRDGFRECWGSLADPEPHILDYYKPGQIKKSGEPLVNILVRQGKARMADIKEADLCNARGEVRPDHERRRLQRRYTLANQEYRSPELSRLVTAWRYPLHFIDFETSRIAVPYHAGMRPYELVAFQWSCHQVNGPGLDPVHFEWINVRDAYPNVDFAQSLRECLGETGTVLTWSHHERSVLNDINEQLARYGKGEPDLNSWLMRVVKEDTATGLSMVDLCKVARQHYFHPRMKGRLSIKQVLPAVWESNPRLHAHPSFARYYRRDEVGQLIEPYLTLPAPPFGASGDEHQEVVKDGGGAMRAYQEMMYGLSKDNATQRANWKRLLLQYCELDTAAMVMIWIHWAKPIARL